MNNQHTPPRGFRVAAYAWNETVAAQFCEHWTGHGFTAYAVPASGVAKDGTYLGSWTVYKSRRRVIKPATF